MTDKDPKRRAPGRRISMKARKSKVEVDRLASMPAGFSWYRDLEKMIPRVLAGEDLRRLTARILRAVREQRPLVLMMGAHVVKCGLGGLIGDMVRKGLVTSVAMNGACAIHDVELAVWGRTSEDVDEGIRKGEFGMTRETAAFFARAADRCLSQDLGMGEALIAELSETRAPYRERSIIAACSDAERTLTVHVALGTDVVHQHEEADGKAIGFGTMKDFRSFATRISQLNGGVSEGRRHGPQLRGRPRRLHHGQLRHVFPL
jgi:hypothetical protein